MTDLCDDPNAEALCANAVQEAVRADPRSPVAWLAAAELRASQSRRADVVAALRQWTVAVGLDGGQTAWVPGTAQQEEEPEFARAAGLCVEAHEDAEAERFAQLALAVDDSLFGAWRALAFAQWGQGRAEEAVGSMQHAVELAAEGAADGSLDAAVAEQLKETRAMIKSGAAMPRRPLDD